MGKFFKTPKATCGYTHVQRPSKFKKFETEVRFKSEKDIEQIVTAVRDMIAEEFGPKKAAKAKLPWKHDEETGEVVLKTQSKYKPKVYNAKGEQIPAKRVPAVYSGSTVKVGIKFDTYDNDGKYGVTARFQSLQIIKLVAGTGGFEDATDEDEDAYVGDGEDGGDYDDEEVDENEDNDGDDEEDEDEKPKAKSKSKSKKSKDDEEDDDDPTAF